jgi:hypothetical protein
MNIFYLEHNTKKCAEQHVDKHAVKMCVEYAQLLCSAHWMSGGQAPYKLAHKNHPCSIWVRQNINNYRWLCELGLAVCNEFSYRYGKTHKSCDVIWWCIENEPNLPDGEFTEPPQAMPDEFKVINDSITAYRKYYAFGKKHLHSWKGREIPEWLDIYEYVTPDI